MLNVVCFYFGNWCGNRGIEYVNKLYKATVRNLSLPHQFYCFTDKPENEYDVGINIIPIQVEGWPWNFPKLLIYNRKFHNLEGRILLFDLDLVITGSLNDLASWTGRWITCEAAYQKGQIGGSIISFSLSAYLEELLWNPVSTSMGRFKLGKDTRGGSERFYYRQQFKRDRFDIDFWQDEFPGQILSYKRDILPKNKVPLDTRIVRFHGKPRPHEVEEPWVKQHWR